MQLFSWKFNITEGHSFMLVIDKIILL